MQKQKRENCLRGEVGEISGTDEYREDYIPICIDDITSLKCYGNSINMIGGYNGGAMEYVLTDDGKLYIGEFDVDT